MKMTWKSKFKVELELHQMKLGKLVVFKFYCKSLTNLGGSAMSLGQASQHGTVSKMLEGAGKGRDLVNLLQKQFENIEIEFSKKFFVTRGLKQDSIDKIQKKGTLFDRKDMWNEIWSDDIKQFAKDNTIGWILPGTLYKEILFRFN